uniref:Uncharacterized protein n=1 Tax=Mesocestoides corti TaxID=53468 RepID=A0A5K3G7G6_MESCO
MVESFNVSVMANTRHLGTQSLVKCEQRGVMVASCDQECDLQLHGVMWALNGAPGTDSQSTHDVSVSIGAHGNEPTGERYKQADPVKRPYFPP